MEMMSNKRKSYNLGDEHVRDELPARVFRAQPGRVPYKDPSSFILDEKFHSLHRSPTLNRFRKGPVLV